MKELIEYIVFKPKTVDGINFPFYPHWVPKDLVSSVSTNSNKFTELLDTVLEKSVPFRQRHTELITLELFKYRVKIEGALEAGKLKTDTLYKVKELEIEKVEDWGPFHEYVSPDYWAQIKNVPFISESCEGEKCYCGKPATHKVGEEIFHDDPNPERHNFTRYVCCEHFVLIFGKVAKKFCDSGHKLI